MRELKKLKFTASEDTETTISRRVVQGKRKLQDSVDALSSANKPVCLEVVHRRLHHGLEHVTVRVPVSYLV